MRREKLVCVLLMGIAGCGGKSTGAPGVPGDAAVGQDADNADAPEPDAGPDALLSPPGPTSRRLITSTYSIPSGTEFYQCERVTLTEDLWVTKVTPVASGGTHHTVVAVDPSVGGAKTQVGCRAFEGDWLIFFASGVGSPSLEMPPGVGLHLPAGREIVLNLHLFNTGLETLDGETAIDVDVAPQASIANEAAVVAAGSVRFNIYPGDNQKINGTCTMKQPGHVFAVFPHMHQYGKHIKIWTDKAGVQSVLWDEDYDFSDQRFGTFAPVPLAIGDKVRVECTYNNDSGMIIPFGESSTQEMCFSLSYIYPPPPGSGALGPVCAM